jgi:hypothetical protein
MSVAFQVLDNTQQSRHMRPSVRGASDLIHGDVSGMAPWKMQIFPIVGGS